MLAKVEMEQGKCLLPSKVYVHTDKKGFKRLYVLGIIQRIFMFFEDPKSSLIGQFFGLGMLAVIVLNLIIFIISSLDTFKYQPDTCDAPACDNHATLCPGTTICEPTAVAWTQSVELVCVILFTVEYLARMLLVWSVPPRLSDVLMKKKKKNVTMSSIFTTNRPSSKDELFAYVKAVLEESEAESAMTMGRRPRNPVGASTGKDPHREAIESELMNVSPSSSVVTSGKFSLPTDSRQGSGKYTLNDSPNNVPRSGTPLNPVDEGEPSVGELELSEKAINALQQAADSEEYDADEGLVLGDMNKPIFGPIEEPLGDRDNSMDGYGKHSKVAATPPQSNEPMQSRQQQKDDRRAHRVREKRQSHAQMHLFNDDDNIEDVAAKSLSMDRSHRYSGLYKSWIYGIKMLNLIDLVAILPFYIEIIVGSGNSSLSVVRVLRLARVFRIFKMGKGSSGVQMLGKTIWISLPALSLLFFFIILGVILFGAIVYFLEAGDFKVLADFPDGAYVTNDFFGVEQVRTTFTSIFAGCYWAVVTTTTTGYGEMVPLSFLGKVVSILCAYYGVLLLALPITVIGNNFDKTLNAQQGRDNEQFIYECLAGITRSLDVEYRARTKLAPVPSSAYKLTLITAIISTFDTTKQTLLKDAISSANREALAKRHHSAPSHTRTSDDIDGGEDDAPPSTTKHLQEAVDMIKDSSGNNKGGGSEDQSDNRYGSMSSYEFEAAKRRQTRDDGDIMISASETSGALYDGGLKLGDAHVEGNAESKKSDDSQNGANAPPVQQKMAGITWTNMPALPRKRTADTEMKRMKGQSSYKVTATEALVEAQKELQDSIAAWSALLSAEKINEKDISIDTGVYNSSDDENEDSFMRDS
jgi:voltage-gated potassium channel Kch